MKMKINNEMLWQWNGRDDDDGDDYDGDDDDDNHEDDNDIGFILG